MSTIAPVTDAKTCTACGVEKPVTEFHAARMQSRGLRTPRGGKGVVSCCKECKAELRRPGITAERRRRAELAARGLKQCTKCAVTLPFDAFHISRSTKDGRAYRCPECVKANGRVWREANPDAFRRWSADKKDYLRRRYREWREANSEHVAESYSVWAKANPDKINALIAKRNAIKKNALAPWADLTAIRAIYAEATRLTKETGIRHEVDHIYPLQGETCCGLHVENNLQILTKTENIRKKNRMPEEYAAMVREMAA